MASRKPLVEFFATVKSTRKLTNAGERRYKSRDGDPDHNADEHQQLIVQLVLVDPEDIRAMDDFTSGPQGMLTVPFRVMSKDDFKRQRCDPNQPPSDGVGPDDELARFRKQYVQLMQSDGTDEAPAPDSLTG